MSESRPIRSGRGLQPPVRRLVVVGSGIAGLYAALLAADAANAAYGTNEAELEVVLLSKAALEQSNTFYAQGGVSAVLTPGEAAPGDSIAAHIADTLAAGAGMNNKDAVRILCTEAVRDIAGLERFGVNFDRSTSGQRALGLEAAHSAPRILHAGGDATGAGIARGLIAAVLERAVTGRLRLVTDAFVTELSTSGGHISGVRYLHNGQSNFLDAEAVILATGGAGRLFARTTNPAVATADGLALAWRAGAAVQNLEFFQFHPTTLAVAEQPGGAPPLLISEAVRGEGAVLLDAHGHRFMPEYHPDAELAPRDVVSRSIALHLARTGASADSPVFLDARGIETSKGTGFLARRFPTLSATTRAAGYDWTLEPLPVSPAAHYWMGGVTTDLWGRTSVPGLYAAGEVACTGAQGANRLASNSLLEGLVFGRRAVEAFLGAPAPERSSVTDGISWQGPAPAGDDDLRAAALQGPEDSFGRDGFAAGDFSRDALSRLMTQAAGVLRSGAELDKAELQLAAWADDFPPTDALDQRGHEDGNLLLAARLLVTSARARKDSVGAHYRTENASGMQQAAPNHSMQRICS